MNSLLIINNQIINIIMTTQTYTEQYDYIYDLLVDKELDEELLDFLYHVPNHEEKKGPEISGPAWHKVRRGKIRTLK